MKKYLGYIGLLLLTGCASLSRDCSSTYAEEFGSNWVVVQVGFDGKPFRCWALRNVAITNEKASDGIYWKDSASGNLIHISGLYNRVQVIDENWDHAYWTLGVTSGYCNKVRETKLTTEGELK